jgi:DNA-binding Lrp family transcriptional regulator
MLQPRDLLVALKLHLIPNPQISFEKLEDEAGLSSSTLHRSVNRLVDAGLLTKKRQVKRADLRDFILYGVRYAYYVKRGEPTRGLPTAYATSPLDKIVSSVGEDVPVWPDPLGTVRGYSVEPLDKSVPEAARRDPRLYELLALVDAIRIGRPREYKLAAKEISTRLSSGQRPPSSD